MFLEGCNSQRKEPKGNEMGTLKRCQCPRLTTALFTTAKQGSPEHPPRNEGMVRVTWEY